MVLEAIVATALLVSFFGVWRIVHSSPGQPRMPDGSPYNPREEIWKVRGNGYTSDSGSSGPYR